MMARFLIIAVSFLGALLSAADPVVPSLPPRPLSPIPACLSQQALDSAAVDAAVRAASDSGSLDPAQRIAGLLVLSQLATGDSAGFPFFQSAAKEVAAHGWATEAAGYLKSVAIKIRVSHVIDGLDSEETAEQKTWDHLVHLRETLVDGRIPEFWLNQAHHKERLPPDQKRWLESVLANEDAWDLRSPERRWLETYPRPPGPRPHSNPDDPVERERLDDARIEEHWILGNSGDSKVSRAAYLDISIAALRDMESPAARFAALRLEAIRAVMVRCDPQEAHTIQLQIVACDAKLISYDAAWNYNNLRHILHTCGFTEPERIGSETFTGVVAGDFNGVEAKVPPLVCDPQYPRANLLCHLVASPEWWTFDGVDYEGLISGIDANPVQKKWILAKRVLHKRR